jgi:PHP family Zn ribbon phosphoesterase
MAENFENIKMAEVDFECFEQDCEGVISFNLKSALNKQFQAICPKCHRSYKFDSELKEKLVKLNDLIAAIRKAEDILGSCSVAVVLPEKTVKVPYALLLTRLNTMITLSLNNKDVDFHFRVEPASEKTFR